MCHFYNSGPATIFDQGIDILVGVPSFGTNKNSAPERCGPGVNGGIGQYKEDSSLYVDIFNHIEWIIDLIGEF